MPHPTPAAWDAPGATGPRLAPTAPGGAAPAALAAATAPQAGFWLAARGLLPLSLSIQEQVAVTRAWRLAQASGKCVDPAASRTRRGCVYT